MSDNKDADCINKYTKTHPHLHKSHELIEKEATDREAVNAQLVYSIAIKLNLNQITLPKFESSEFHSFVAPSATYF